MIKRNINGHMLDVLGPGDAGYGRPERQQDLRVSEKGCVSLYGLRRFPISLYASEWEAILSRADEIRAFIVDHPELSRKQS